MSKSKDIVNGVKYGLALATMIKCPDNGHGWVQTICSVIVNLMSAALIVAKFVKERVSTTWTILRKDLDTSLTSFEHRLGSSPIFVVHGILELHVWRNCTDKRF